MPENLRPYTVSAVVNTATGDLAGTPVVRSGHEDYDGFTSSEPLAATEQFRWVHVWAPDRAAAASTDALTVDLRPRADPRMTVARALAGDAGLKPYSVAAAVHTRTGRPISEPVVAEGHHTLGGATLVARQGTRARTANVWARNAAEAVDQVFGPDRAARNAVGLRLIESTRGDPPDDSHVVALDATALARREWNRLAGMPADVRAALVADTVWNREYPPAYRTAYLAAASRIAVAAADAATAYPGAWATLHQLAASAGEAISRLDPGHPLPPPADRPTVTAARLAAGKPGQQPAWERVADTAVAGSRAAGAVAGTVTAATDILIGWRDRSGPFLAEGVTVNGQPAGAWVADLLARVNREIVTVHTAAAAFDRTAAQLAHEDQAPGVSAMTSSPVSSRVRTGASPAPAPRTERTR